jgi:hypothetical protein
MDTTAWGRLADVEVLADGSMLVTNDRRGEIYRITYVGDMTHGTDLRDRVWLRGSVCGGGNPGAAFTHTCNDRDKQRDLIRFD